MHPAVNSHGLPFGYEIHVFFNCILQQLYYISIFTVPSSHFVINKVSLLMMPHGRASYVCYLQHLNQSTNPHTYPSIQSSIHPFTHPSMHPIIQSSIHPPTHPIIHPSIQHFIHPSIHFYISRNLSVIVVHLPNWPQSVFHSQAKVLDICPLINQLMTMQSIS